MQPINIHPQCPPERVAIYKVRPDRSLRLGPSRTLRPGTIVQADRVWVAKNAKHILEAEQGAKPVEAIESAFEDGLTKAVSKPPKKG